MSRTRLFLAGAITLMLLLGVVAWKIVPAIFWTRDDVPRAQRTAGEDPRLSYQGPLRNIHPDVQYVGSKACLRCHSGLVEDFAKTPMGRSLIPMSVLAEKPWYDQAHHNPFKAFDSVLSIDREDKRVWHSQSKADHQGQPIFQDKRPVHYAIGSGNHGHSFLSVEGDGYLFQTPISWFGKTQQFWDVSPGFRDFKRRPVSGDCMFCHADQAVALEDYNNRFQMPARGWQAIGCERCHGPGAKHVLNPGLKELADEVAIRSAFKKDVAKADLTIVNPGKLRPQLAEAVCQQCHLEGEVRLLRRGRGLYDYRPGLPLDLFWSVFVDGRESGEDKKAVNHVEQMVLSRCFQRSKGDNKLGCITCHDPHHVPVKEAERPAYFREKCWKCHAPADAVEKDKVPCKVPLAQRLLENQDNCLACHMRPYGTSDIAHAASTDHRILRRREKDKAGSVHPSGEINLVHFHKGKMDLRDPELARDFGIALSMVAGKKDAKRSLPQVMDILERALQAFPDDVDIWREKGMTLLNQTRLTEALAAFETVLKYRPENEFALERAALIHQLLGELKPSLELWKRAAARNPWMATYQSSTTRLLVHQAAWDDVGPPCRQWLRLSPGNVEARKIFVEYLVRTGNEPEARTELVRLEALRPGDSESLKAWFSDLKKVVQKK